MSYKLMQRVNALKRVNQVLQQRIAWGVAELDLSLQTARAIASSLDMQAVWRAVSMGLGQMISPLIP